MLDSDKAILIACKALTPFVTFDLLVDDKTPKDNVSDIRIADLFHNLDDQDQKFGLHVVDSILQTLADLSKAEGYSIVLGKGDLVKGLYPTIGALATALRAYSKPI